MRPLSRFHHLLILCISGLGMAAGGSSCTLKQKDSHTVRISIPRMAGSSSSLLARSAASLSAFTAPSSLSDFTCFGIQVSGPGIPADPRLGCVGSEPNLGRLAGLVPATGGEIDIVVPAGPGRFIQVFAVQSAIGCPGMDLLLERPPATRFQDVSKPIEVGTAMTDLFEDVTVTVAAKYEAGVSRELFSSCGGSGLLGKAPPAGEFSGGSVIATAGTCNSGVGRPCLNGRVGFSAIPVSGGLTAVPAPGSRWGLQFGSFLTDR